MREQLIVLGALILAGTLCRPAAATTVEDNQQTNGCTTNSTETFDSQNNQTITVIYSIPCAVSITTANTRYQRDGTTETQVAVPYMVHEPPSGTSTKAIVVLLTGGDGCAQIAPFANPPLSYPLDNPCASPADATAYRNFLIRSAQLFANHGFKTITIDRPFNLNPPTATYDDYRRSQMHAVDIAGVVSQENPNNRAVFLVGTSRGTLSAVAQSVMGTAAMLSSPVTSGSAAYLDDGIEPEFQAAWFVAPVVSLPLPVPVQILEHKHDGCSVSSPSGAKTLNQNLMSAGVQTFFHEVIGGFEEVGGDPCEALSHHGFLGIERRVVRRISKQMTSILNDINTAYPGNHRPVSANASLATPASTPVSLDLTTVATDPDGDALIFALPHLKSARGATLSLGADGKTLTYDASSAGFTGTVNDSFVYVASDQNGQNGQGKKSFGIVTVTVAP